MAILAVHLTGLTMPLPLSTETRTRITSALIEGNSIRATARMVGANRETVMRFALRAGEGCAVLHSRIVRGVAAHLIQCDETFSYIWKKERRLLPTDPAEWGDAYTFLALDAVTKLVISWEVGKRSDAFARAFVTDLRARLTVEPQISTDGFSPYIEAIARAFHGAVDYGQVIKRIKGGSGKGDAFDKYEPGREVFVELRPISGAPDMDTVSTSYIERLNGTLRHMVGRKRRRCLAFSKTIRGHRAAVALAVMAYNFVRIHGALGTTPAVAAGLVERPWTVGEMMEAALDEPDVEPPIAMPLAPRPGAMAARQTATGRVLRLVHGGTAGSRREAPTGEPPPIQAIEPRDPDDDPPEPAGWEQLDLLAWRPRAQQMPEKGQLPLFPALD